MELAELSAVGQLHGRLEVRDGPPLRAGLEHPPVAAHRFVHRLAEADRDPAGLLAVDVLAGLEGEDRAHRVPVIAGGDQHGVDVRPGEQLEHVAVRGTVVVAVLGVGHGLDRLAPAGPDIADGHELHVRLGDHAFQVVPAARADADGPQDDALAGGHDAVAAQGPAGRSTAGRRAGHGERLLQELAAVLGRPAISLLMKTPRLEKSSPVDRAARRRAHRQCPILTTARPRCKRRGSPRAARRVSTWHGHLARVEFHGRPGNAG